MKTLKGKSYRPEFTQLPYGFVNDNVTLQRLMRTENGLAYFSMYIAIQDRMANHSDEDFTLSYDELIWESQSFLQLYSTSEETIKGWIDDLLKANIIESVLYVNPYTDKEEMRYFIASVADKLRLSREAWITKIINPMKLSDDEKEKLKSLTDDANEIQRQIRRVRAKKSCYQKELSMEFKSKSEFKKEFAKALYTEIAACDREIASLYRSYHTLDHHRQALMKGGDVDD